MDNHFWDSIRSELHKSVRMPPDNRMIQYPTPYSHPYAREVQWNYHANNMNNQGFPPSDRMSSPEQDMAGGSAVLKDDVMKQNLEGLIDDVETLRRVITQQQQILEALRHQQGVVSGDCVRHESAILTLTSARPARDAWVAQADVSINYIKKEITERPSREELSVAITTAVNPLSSKLEALDSSIRSISSSPQDGQGVQDSDLRRKIIEIVESMKFGTGDSGNSRLTVMELEEAKFALNAAKQQLVAQTQHSERLVSQSHSQSSSQQFTSPHPIGEPAAMEEYWQRIQGFVAAKLGEFEARIKNTSPVSPAYQVSEDRVQALERGLREANNTISGLTAQVEQLRSSTALRDVHSTITEEVRSTIEISDAKRTRQVNELVESALVKESSRWERKLDDALESTVGRCRIACKHDIDKALSSAETAAEHLVEASRSNSDSVFLEAERRLKTSVDESRESINRAARKVSEVEDRVDQMERAMRTDIRRLRDDMRDSSESADRRFAQTPPSQPPQLSQAALNAAVTTLLSVAASPQTSQFTMQPNLMTTQMQPPSMPFHAHASPHSSFASPNKTEHWQSSNKRDVVYQDRLEGAHMNAPDTAQSNHALNYSPHSSFGNTHESTPLKSSEPMSLQTNVGRGQKSPNTAPISLQGVDGDAGVSSTTSSPKHESSPRAKARLGPIKSLKVNEVVRRPSRSPSPKEDPDSHKETNESNSTPTSISRRRRSISIAHVDDDPPSSSSMPTSPLPRDNHRDSLRDRGRGKSEPPLPNPMTLVSLEAGAQALLSSDVDDEENDHMDMGKLRSVFPSNRVTPRSPATDAVDLEESGDSFEASSESASSKRHDRKHMPRPRSIHSKTRDIPSRAASLPNFPKEEDITNSFDINDAAGPDGPPPPLADSRPSQLIQSPSVKEAASPNSLGSQSVSGSTFQSASSSSSSVASSHMNQSNQPTPSTKVSTAKSTAAADPKLLTVEKALAIRGSPVPATCEFNPEDQIDLQLRAEGWSKHSGKNGNTFWAAIGDAKLSTWSRPVPGELAVKKRQHASVKAVCDACLEIGAVTQAEVDSVWALILNKTRTPEAVVKEWRAKEAAEKKKIASSPQTQKSKVPSVNTLRGHSALSQGPGVGDRNARAGLSLGDSSDSLDASDRSSPISTQRSSVFSAFSKKNVTANTDFATKALTWNKQELVAHLRGLGLTPIAEMFENEVIDSKTLALMETEDFTSPSPQGFGLSEEDPMFQTLWALKIKLKAALDRAKMRENFEKKL